MPFVPSWLVAPAFRAARQALPWLLTLAVATCAEDTLGPSRTGVGFLSLRPSFPNMGGSSLRQFGIVADTVRIRLTRPEDQLVLDTAVAFPADSAQLQLALSVPLNEDVERFDVVISIGARGTVIFLDSTQVTVRSGPPGRTPPLDVTFAYVGPGSEIAQLTIAPGDTTVTLGDTLVYEATAIDSADASVPEFYVSWKTSDTAVARVNANGRLIAPLVRGTVRVIGMTPSGIGDTSIITFASTPASLEVDGGDQQSATVETPFVDSLTVRVLDSEAEAVPGVTVGWSVVSGDALLSGLTSLTGADGRARIGIIAGSEAGPVQVLATVAGLADTAAFLLAVVPGAPTAFTVSTGAGQAGSAGLPLPLPVVVLITDGLGNPVPGATVEFAIVAGAGSVEFPTVTTDALGLASSGVWTLGVAGTNRLRATSPAVPTDTLLIDAGATPLGTTTTFMNGGGDGDWFNATNWTAGVPDSADNVFVDPDQTVTVGAPARANRVVVGAGASILLNAPLVVDSSVVAGNTISGGGQLVAQGSGELSGQVGDLFVTGTYALAPGARLLAGSIEVGGVGSFDLNGGRADVAADFSTSGTAVLRMTRAADSLLVGGNFTAGGGNTTGLLTAGVLEVAGDFTQATGAVNSFRADGGHTTRFAGGTGSRTIALATPVRPVDPPTAADSRFGRLVLVDGVDSLATTVAVAQDLIVESAQLLGTLAGAGRLTVAGNVTVRTTAAGFSSQELSLGGALDFELTADAYQVGTTLYFGDGQTIVPLPYGNLQVANGTATLGGDVTVAGEVRAGRTGHSGDLDLGGHTLVVLGSFVVAGQGTLTMNDAGDSLDVRGPVDMNGAANRGLTDGVLVARGDFIMRDSTYIASGAHRTVFANIAQTQLHNLAPELNANRFNKLTVTTGSSVRFNTIGTGALTVSDTFWVNGFFRQGAIGQKVIAIGDVYIGTSVSFVIDTLELHQALNVDASTYSVILTRYVGVGQVITATAFYRGLEVTGTAIMDTTLVVVTRDAIVRGNGVLDLGADELQVTGAFRTFDNGRVALTDPRARLLVTGDASFAGGDQSGLLTAGLISIRGNFTQSTGSSTNSFRSTGTAVEFPFTGTSHAVAFADPDSSFFHQVTAPGTDTLQLAITGRTRVTNRLSAQRVQIGGGLGNELSVDSLDLGVTQGSVNLGTLRVGRLTFAQTPNWTVATTEFVGDQQIPGLNYDTLQVSGSDTVSGAISATRLLVTGRLVLLSGRALTVNRDAIVRGAGSVLAISGGSALVNGNFVTENEGVLRMDNALSQLTVVGNARFDGGSTTGLLTDGVLQIQGSFGQRSLSSPSSFDAGADNLNFLTRFTGGPVHDISLEDPGSSRFGVLQLNFDSLRLSTTAVASSFVGNGGFVVSNDAQLTATRDMEVDGVVFDHTRIVFDGPGRPFFFDNSEFVNMNPGRPQLKLNFDGAGATFNSIDFDDSGAIFVEATSFSGSAFSISIFSPDFATGPAKTSTPGGQVTVAWGP